MKQKHTKQQQSFDQPCCLSKWSKKNTNSYSSAKKRKPPNMPCLGKIVCFGKRTGCNKPQLPFCQQVPKPRNKVETAWCFQKNMDDSFPPPKMGKNKGVDCLAPTMGNFLQKLQLIYLTLGIQLASEKVFNLQTKHPSSYLLSFAIWIPRA